MKAALKWAAGAAGLVLGIGVALGQNHGLGEKQVLNPAAVWQYQELQWGNHPNWELGYGQESAPSGPFLGARKLIGQQVNDGRGRNLGKLSDIILSVENGQNLAAIDIGNGKTALVPVQTLTVSGSRGNPQVTCSCSRADLQDGPTVPSNHWMTALSQNPGLPDRVYSYYHIPSPPEGMGGAP
jgi:PRC-barrel domain